MILMIQNCATEFDWAMLGYVYTPGFYIIYDVSYTRNDHSTESPLVV